MNRRKRRYVRRANRRTGGLAQFTSTGKGTSVEKKYTDKGSVIYAMGGLVGVSAGTKTVDDATFFSIMPSVPAGSGATERIGRKISVKNILVRGSYYLIPQQVDIVTPVSDANPNVPQPQGQYCPFNRVRIILYVDKQTNNAVQPTAQGTVRDKLLQSSDIDSFYNMEEVGRFRVLKDKTFAVNSQGAGGLSDGQSPIIYGGQKKQFKWNIKFRKPLDLYFLNNTSGTVADLTSNRIGLMVLADNGSNSTPVRWFAPFETEVNCRVRYFD